MSDNGVKLLVEYLFDCRIDYVRMCKLDENRGISDMSSGEKYLRHRIVIRRNRGEKISSALEKRALEIFVEKEKEVITKI